MGLLDKLEQVEIKADSRLPEDDLMFCETQQQAYDESCRALREIRQQWKKAIQAQRDLLGIGQDGSLPYFGSNYRFGITDLNRELEKFHSRFISELTQHFNEKYSFANGTSRYRWQPGDAEVKLPYGGASICNAGWENGVLQLVMKGPAEENEWTAPENWYFIDTRTGAVIYPDPSVHFSPPSAFDPDATDADWCYIWEFVTIDKEALPYLEMHWGGKEIYTTVLPGKWKVTLEETPVTIASEVLAENVPLTYGGEELTAERIECSKLSVAVYFADYVDSTTGILGAFRVFDADGKPIPCDWSFTADQADDSCMIWTRFDEPIEPECICRLTFNGETVFER